MTKRSKKQTAPQKTAEALVKPLAEALVPQVEAWIAAGEGRGEARTHGATVKAVVACRANGPSPLLLGKMELSIPLEVALFTGQRPRSAKKTTKKVQDGQSSDQ